jgi:hypothetical protein
MRDFLLTGRTVSAIMCKNSAKGKNMNSFVFAYAYYYYYFTKK